MKTYDVYIMSSRSGVLYVGITSDLVERVWQHKQKLFEGFTAKYNVNRLVWYESFTDVNEAIACEKRLKGWRRSKKVALIEETNPTWRDLAEEFEQPTHVIPSVLARDLDSAVVSSVPEIPRE